MRTNNLLQLVWKSITAEEAARFARISRVDSSACPQGAANRAGQARNCPDAEGGVYRPPPGRPPVHGADKRWSRQTMRCECSGPVKLFMVNRLMKMGKPRWAESGSG